jgi:prepilin signal peptidase PulO-like enzyme (type II secretory pathway)
MDVLLAIGAAGLGLIIGSFLNALSFRFKTGMSIVHGRSRCMRCGHVLSAWELIPVISYMLLRGRCHSCHSRISIQYPLVEACAGLLSFGVYTLNQTPLLFGFWFVVWMLILFIVVYDIRHTVIPWSYSGLLILLSLVYVFCIATPTVNALLAGPLLALPLAAVSLLSRGTWMGWGDGMFELSLGWLLGLLEGLTAFMLAIWIGAAVGVALVLWAQRPSQRNTGFTMKSELPFAPFLALGAALCYFFHVDFFSQLAVLW